MEKKEKIAILRDAYEQSRALGKVKSQREFAAILDINEANLSRALKGNEQYLTPNLISKVKALTKNYQTGTITSETIPVIPTGARAGTLADWSESIHEYECERIISPIKGADYAMQVTGDSMSPEYPSGSQIIIKRIDEEAFIEWGKVYLLDTKNGPVLKQVRKTETLGVIECVSLNPAYQPFTVDCKYISGWYRVLMCLSLK